MYRGVLGMENDQKSLVFEIGNEEYGIWINHVLSIEKVHSIRSIPQFPSYMRGIVKVREELIPVIDFQNVLLGNSIREEELKESKLVVLYVENQRMGLLVKETKEILSLEESSLKQVGLMGYSKTKYFFAVANLENRLITMIDPAILISSLEGIKEIQDYMKNQPA
jgi:purine-binding chemotaxis protein CheW